jgi:hypothetical protein
MAYDFDGTGDFLSYGSLASLNGLTAMTVAGWVQMDTLTADGGILCTRNSTDFDGFLFFYDDAAAASGRSDTFGLFVENGATQVRIEGATGAATTGAWQHVCVTFLAGSSTGIRLYVNGVEDANSPSSSIGITNSGASANVQLQIGNAHDFTRDIDGKLAEVAGWNRVLSAEEIAALAKGFSPKFFPGLAFYAPLVRDDADVVSGTDASVNGTPSVFPHPPIIYPSRPLAVSPAAPAAPGGISVPVALYHQRHHNKAA